MRMNSKDWYLSKINHVTYRTEHSLWSFEEDCTHELQHHRSTSKPGQRLMFHHTCEKTRACFDLMFNKLLTPSFRQQAVDFIVSLLCGFNTHTTLVDYSEDWFKVTWIIEEFVRRSCPSFVKMVNFEEKYTVQPSTRLLCLHRYAGKPFLLDELHALRCAYPNLHIICCATGVNAASSTSSTSSLGYTKLNIQTWRNVLDICEPHLSKWYQAQLMILKQQLRHSFEKYLFGIMRLVIDDYKIQVSTRLLKTYVNPDVVAYVLHTFLREKCSFK
jgi:hypothetical protein